jgi:cobalt-zinc-cadmium efflux system outer membrane protein
MKILFIAFLLALTGGCATVPRDAGFADVQGMLDGRIDQKPRWNRDGEDDRAAADAIDDLLKEPLTADAAVQVALLGNRGLQASYGELGVAQTDLVQAGLLRNPAFSAGRIRSPELVTTSLGVAFDFLGILLRPRAKQVEAARFEAVKLRVADEVLRTAADVRVAYYRTLASQQDAAIQASVLRSSEVAADLAARQYNAGNVSLRDQSRQQAMYIETRAQLARLRQQALNDRERLNRLLGLWGPQTQWTLPARLPEVPQARPAYVNVEGTAIAQRLDVAAARRDVEYVGEVLGITRTTRYLAVLDAGIDWEKDAGAPAQVGPTLRLELPLFDQGQARTAKYEAMFRQSGDRLAQVAVDARAQAREKDNDLLSAWEIARQQQNALVPLRQRILSQTQLFYNGMLEGVYDLLADYRESAAAAQGLVNAQRDYWIALAELERAVGGRLPASATPGAGSIPPSPAPPELDAVKPRGHEHH